MLLGDFFELAFTGAFLGIGFLITSIILLVSGKKQGAAREMGYVDALVMGCFQAFAILPGVSRSGATILGALLLGVSRTTAAEYTFYLAIPVMFGASLLKLLKFGLAFSTAEMIVLAIGLISAFAVSVAVIKFLMGFIRKHDFSAFGWYRIVLGAVVILYFLFAR